MKGRSVMPKSVRSASGKQKLGLSLLVIATAQLMLVLDDTIANIALPSIQHDLGVSTATLPWIVNAYVLVFGSLLLFGGRLGDLFGRRKVLRVGLGIFVIASLLGGLGVNAELLIAARALQGIGAALVAPNVLALIATTFPLGKQRNSAMAVYGAMSALGITVGVLLGGVLVGLLDWRWVFWINVPIGLGVLLGTKVLAEGSRGRGRLDTLGAVVGTVAMIALTYGITRGGEHGWVEPVTLTSLMVAAIGLAAFLNLQKRSSHALLPLGLFRNRNRSGSYATILFIGGGLMGAYYLLTLFLQQVQHFDPIRAGLAALPFSIGIVLAAGVSSKLVAKYAPRKVATPGLLLAAVGMLWLSTLNVDSSYFLHIMPAIFITMFGLGVSFVPMTLTAVHGVDENHAGVASALVNMAQQIGAALGLAVFTSVAIAATGTQASGASEVMLTHGYTTAFLVGAVLLVVAALIAAWSVNAPRSQEVEK